MRISPERYRNITAIALGLLMVIVVTGAAVRLTGSGLGCDDWPRCNDQQLVDVSSGHAAIEQVNRLFTGLVALAVILAVLGSLWRQPRRRDLTWLSLGLVAGVIGQIVLGRDHGARRPQPGRRRQPHAAVAGDRRLRRGAGEAGR